MFDQHVLDALVQLQILSAFGQLGVCVEQERELSKHSEFTFDLNPTRTSKERPLVIPLFDRFQTRTENLEPNVQALLVQADTQKRSELGVHLKSGRVVAEVD